MENLTQIMYYCTVAVMFSILDIVTGLWAAVVTGTYKSSIMREGGRHKITLFLAVIFGVAIDYAQTVVALGFSIPATLLICGYIVIMEIGSCKENIIKANDRALPHTVSEVIDEAVSSISPTEKEG